MRMIHVMIALAALADAASAAPISGTAFIDHCNLRYGYRVDEPKLREETHEIKRNLAEAKRCGVGTYIMFSRGFEYLINYDFTLAGLGDLTGRVYPPDSDHRKTQRLYAERLTEVLDYASRIGIKVIFHTNQFDFPDSLYKLAAGSMAGTARVCPGKQMTYDALERKIEEFFTRFPKCSGLQLTLSETQVEPIECACDACRGLNTSQRFAKVVLSAQRACRGLGKTLSVRAWGGFDTSESASVPTGVLYSTKNTQGDFHINSRANSLIGSPAGSQEVEFDAWGEYCGFSYFPCYMGDVFAERIRLCAAKGADRLAVRLNWNYGLNYMFDRPFGNIANVRVFLGLAANPNADPDALLKAYIAEVFPASAREAAFRLYKGSREIQSVWLTWGGRDLIDHSRVFRNDIERVGAQASRMLSPSYADANKVVDARRAQLDQAKREALTLVKELGEDVPREWREELERGVQVTWSVAQANCDCVQLYAAHREVKAGRPLPDLAALRKQSQERAEQWKRMDPQSCIVMNGEGALALFAAVERAGGVSARSRQN